MPHTTNDSDLFDYKSILNQLMKDCQNEQRQLEHTGKFISKTCTKILYIFFLPKTTPLESNKYLQLLLHSQ